MPTPSETEDHIDAVLARGATSSNALEQRPEPRRLGVWFGFALVLHAAAFAVFVVFQPTWFARELPVPEPLDATVDVTWLGELHVPAPTPESRHTEPATALQKSPPSRRAPATTIPTPSPVAVQSLAVKPIIAPTPIVAPVRVPESIPAPVSALAQPVESGLTIGPAESFAAIPSPTRQPATAAAGPASTMSPEVPVSTVAARVAPSPIAGSQKPPIYPRASRRGGEAGTVVLRIDVAESGEVTAIVVVNSSGFSRLDAAARTAVKQWRFVPGTVGGVPVTMALRVPIRFELQ